MGRVDWIRGELDTDAISSVNPCRGVGGSAGAGVRYGMFKPCGDEGDWPEETEDARENRLFVLDFFSDGVCFERGFPSMYPCPGCFEATGV